MDQLLLSSYRDVIDYLVRNGIYLIPLYPIDKSTGFCSCEKAGNCSSPGKHPLLHFNWKIVASNDMSKISSWFLGGRKKDKIPANIGVATGRRSKTSDLYLVCVDIDVSEHDLVKRLSKHPTFWYETGGGGYHFWYWCDVPVRNSVSLIAHKVDIRGTNGYVVAPPSNHISGKNYTLGCSLDQEIAIVPEFLVKLIQESYREKNNAVQQSNKEKKPRHLGEAPELTVHWSKIPIPELRQKLSETRVPMGARNVVLHRLLSSDRSKGVTSKLKLRMQARIYRDKFENPDTFSDAELEQVVTSCMRYPAYNNSHQNVNTAYFSWLKKRNLKVTEEMVTQLNTLDSQFFGGLQKTEKEAIPLSHLSRMRNDFFKQNGLKQFSVYRPQLLAKKLQDLGFSRIRTNKGNLWKVGFEVQKPPQLCHNEPTTEVSLSMSTEDTSKPTEPKIITNKKTGEKFRVHVHKTQTKRKRHPNDHLYQNCLNYDFNKAMTEKLATLDPELDMEALMNEELVQDREAVKTFIDSVKIGDTIGVKFNRYQVVGKDDDKGIYVEGEYVDGYPPLLDHGKLDFARWLGFMEILWRDEKPFGVSEFEDYTVNVLIPVNDDGTDKYPADTVATTNSAPPVAPANTQTQPVAQNKKRKRSK